jgi:DNA mismatch repair protein MSH6
MKLTLVDRIFTRLGASDRLLEGKSTFFVEMEECKSIMEHATPRSLAILDELGRGTSTFDGYSLANAVMKHLTHKVRCRSMFSTHYHMLVKDFVCHPKVQCFHMAFK